MAGMRSLRLSRRKKTSEPMSSPVEKSDRFASEDELTGWLREQCARRENRLIGDDAALLPRNEKWAVTMDTQIENVHFASDLEPAAIARRLLAVNLSDLAAVGAQPAYAFLALSAPPDFQHRLFFEALLAECDGFGLELAGGDLSSQPRLMAVLTLLGYKPAGQRWLKRESARPGESLWLGGPIGEAALGLHLLQSGWTEGRPFRLDGDRKIPDSLVSTAKRVVARQLLPRPQLELGNWLGGCGAGAAIDISDGFARDLRRLCTESGVGAEIDLARLPVSEDLEQLAELLGLSWPKLALEGGEDYVLLFSLPNGLVPPSAWDCREIGRITIDEIVLKSNSGTETLQAAGWDHLSKS